MSQKIDIDEDVLGYMADERIFSESFSNTWSMIDGPVSKFKELCMISLFREISKSVDAVKSTDGECRASLARIQASFNNFLILAQAAKVEKTSKTIGITR